ncbi:HK97 gp10 family phage protein [Psychrobacillus sp. FSL K6-1464]|uniref:HK97 gp10 family phage protein n=1 Tax=Psychrobacillus sp. FSL K6-1464 TaxID=2921545 RepID=UPI0030FAD6BC
MGINVNNLADEINRQLALYANQTDESVQRIAEEIAAEGVEMLKADSPKSPGGGEYAKSWSLKKVGKVFVLHNKDHYRLTHLLEKGHAKVNGGRVSARVHIAPVEGKMIEKFEDELRRDLTE